MSSKIAAKWQSYSETILEFLTNPPLRIDLRRAVTREHAAGLASLGLAGPFAVFTAENPRGENSEDAPTKSAEARVEEHNARRESRLERELVARGIPFVLVDGVAPDGGYREHCVAALMARDLAVSFARGLDQLALFWYDGTSFWQLPAEADAQPRQLPASAA